MTKVEDVRAAPMAHTGMLVTKTAHKTPAPALDPHKVTLPRPFVVAITGSGRGLGEGYAKAYAQAGASGIVLAARSEDELQAVAHDISEIVREMDGETQISTVKCDVTVEEDVKNLEKVIKEEHGRLDVLVNNAGFLDVAGWKPITEGNPEDFKKTFDVNIYGVYLVTRTLLPLLLGSDGGAKTVVGISSMSSHFASYSISYSMSKLALNRFIEFLDKEYGKEGLVAHALHPVGVRTKMSTSDAVPTDL
ncbi:NAD(P)-binding protein [Mytilinidion resinicola]|uniref:NAD(P)-binding protein n=1 Tax=Mytilinidion resinicola TaxID=574789 RepID=A0A6A6YA52_9PEZI|nr:NAD(P)-binding protein [Mytilinidion resinicola]KAF2805499.1 NAD(P)-binding protein [Mytilinidion resinicola]